MWMNAWLRQIWDEWQFWTTSSIIYILIIIYSFCIFCLIYDLYRFVIVLSVLPWVIYFFRFSDTSMKYNIIISMPCQWYDTVIANDGKFYDDVTKWKHFRRNWPFVRGIHRSPVNSPHQGQWRRALIFSLIWALNKRLSKQSWGWWFEKPARSLWHNCNTKQSPCLYIPQSA